MSFAIDLTEYASDLKKAYESVISSDPEVKYCVFGYDGSSNALKVIETDNGNLDSFVEAFDDSKVQYGLVRVDFNNINKIVLVGYVGENVSSRQRLVFNSHMATVAKQFSGHHIQITARAEDELSSDIIMERVSTSAGSKYGSGAKIAPPTKPKYVQAQQGANEDDWDEEAVEERELKVVGGSYKSNVREELEAFKTKNKRTTVDTDNKKGIKGLDSSSSYQPVGKIDLKKIREEGKNSKFADARIEKIEPSYKPVGKVDLKAIREQAKREKELKAKRNVESSSLKDEPVKKEEAPTPRSPVTDKRSEPSASGDSDDEPKFTSISDRMKAFQDSVNSAKPQFDTKSRSDYGVGTTKSKLDQKIPLSERLEKTKLDSDETEEEHPTEKAQVSTFAARFAKKNEGSELPSRKEPELPSRKEPELPSRKEPELPSRKEPELPSRKEPELPSRKEPELPSRKEPELPSRKEPELPSRKEPELPSRKEPEHDSITAIVVEAYAADDTDELTLVVGEKITDIEKLDTDWWSGRSKDGKLGLFPAYCVKESSTDSASKVESRNVESRMEEKKEKETKKEETKKDEPKEDNLGIAIALYDYEGGDDDEIAFAVDEKIEVIEFSNEDWWLGRNKAGEEGLFPANYVKL